MSGGYEGNAGDDTAFVPQAVARLASDVRELQKPRAGQIFQQLDTLTGLVTDLEAQVDAVLTTLTYNRVQIDAKDAAVRSEMIDHANNVGLSKHPLNGNLTTSAIYGTNVTGGNVFAQSVATLISATRVSVWGRTSDGFIGTASSSERYKTNIAAATIDAAAVLSIEPVHYQYIAELEERERRAALPVGHAHYNPDYRVGTEVGMVAERLHEAGLWQFVVYKRDQHDYLVLDDDGQPIPDGIHYTMWSVALQAVARAQAAQITELQAQYRDLADKVDRLS